MPPGMTTPSERKQAAPPFLHWLRRSVDASQQRPGEFTKQRLVPHKRDDAICLALLKIRDDVIRIVRGFEHGNVWTAGHPATSSRTAAVCIARTYGLLNTTSTDSTICRIPAGARAKRSTPASVSGRSLSSGQRNESRSNAMACRTRIRSTTIPSRDYPARPGSMVSGDEFSVESVDRKRRRRRSASRRSSRSSRSQRFPLTRL